MTLDHNGRVSFPAKTVICALALALAGCDTPQRRTQTPGPSPKWQSFRATPPAPAEAVPADSGRPQMGLGFRAATPAPSTNGHPAPPRAPGSLPMGSAPTNGELVSVPPRQAQAASKAPEEVWVPVARWAGDSGLAALSRVSPAPPNTYELRSSKGAMTFTVGKQVVRWQGIEVFLGFAPQLTNRQVCLHALDLKSTVQPLLQGFSRWSPASNTVIVIDPGHGGEDPGTSSILGAQREKAYTLDWARRLQQLLATNGWQALLTRSNDTDVALSNRVAFATDQHADLFISLHFNSAAPNQTESGLETYCLTPAGLPSSLRRGFADDTTVVFPNNAFDERNLELALRVHRGLLEGLGMQDRGVRRARFTGVLRGHQCPAVLVEGGYLSNPQEARLIGDPAYRQRMAEAIGRVLLENVETPKPPSELAAGEPAEREMDTEEPVSEGRPPRPTMPSPKNRSP